jgi:hypothetical protein
VVRKDSRENTPSLLAASYFSGQLIIVRIPRSCAAVSKATQLQTALLVWASGYQFTRRVPQRAPISCRIVSPKSSPQNHVGPQKWAGTRNGLAPEMDWHWCGAQKSRCVKEHSERWMKRSRAAPLLEDLWMREPGGDFHETTRSP